VILDPDVSLSPLLDALLRLRLLRVILKQVEQERVILVLDRLVHGLLLLEDASQVILTHLFREGLETGPEQALEGLPAVRSVQPRVVLIELADSRSS